EEGLLKLKEAEKQKVNEIQLTHETFKEDALIYKVEPNSVMILTDEANQVEIRLDPQEMAHVGVWSPYPKRAGFVCLEPWAGVADEEETSGQLKEKYAIHSLNPEQTLTHEYTMQFIKKRKKYPFSLKLHSLTFYLLYTSPAPIPPSTSTAWNPAPSQCSQALSERSPEASIT